MRLPRSDHTERPWRIHEIAHDFTVEDVWALPTPGGSDDLAWLVRQFAEGMESGVKGDGFVSRALFVVRGKLGALFGWDEADSDTDGRRTGLVERLPADLRDGLRGPDLGSSPFTSLYQRKDEWAAEAANKTVRAVMHIGWVPDGAGGYRGQMTVLVKPNGPLGSLYMAAIKPFRYLWVYPALIRSIGREWEANTAARGSTSRNAQGS